MQPCARKVNIRPTLDDTTQLPVVQTSKYQDVYMLQVVAPDMATYYISRKSEILKTRDHIEVSLHLDALG